MEANKINYNNLLISIAIIFAAGFVYNKYQINVQTKDNIEELNIIKKYLLNENDYYHPHDDDEYLAIGNKAEDFGKELKKFAKSKSKEYSSASNKLIKSALSEYDAFTKIMLDKLYHELLKG